jgi:very-short-patch-repair endonuclease
MRDEEKKHEARRLRRTLTEPERQLWRDLRGRRFSGVKFRRQVPIGPYIADFACMAHRLVVEVDGSQHAEERADTARDAYLRSAGWTVLRFWNNEVTGNREGVLTAIAVRCGIEV